MVVVVLNLNQNMKHFWKQKKKTKVPTEAAPGEWARGKEGLGTEPFPWGHHTPSQTGLPLQDCSQYPQYWLLDVDLWKVNNCANSNLE